MCLALTPGEPAGIGPDLTITLAQTQQSIPIVAIADAELLESRAKILGLPLTLISTQGQIPKEPAPAGHLYIDEVKLKVPSQTGQLNKSNAPYVLETIKKATLGCMQKQYSALVTGPVHKGIINDAGISFTGHTEFLAELTQSYPVMMLACPGLRVALVTTHLPISQVSEAITEETLTTVTTLLHQDLMNKFHINNPRILVCGLNPHAGEDGHLGMEEIEIITPTLNKLRKQGMDLIGPLPADTLFNEKHLETADAVLAMYHDQGLPVLKYKGFGEAVNITLGLPVIRTSVDHGTALDLAGTGKANIGSLNSAITAAIEMI